MKKMYLLTLFGSLLFAQVHIYKVDWYIKKGQYFGEHKTETIQSNLKIGRFLKTINANKCEFIKYKVYTLNDGNIKIIPLFKCVYSVIEIKPKKIIVDKTLNENQKTHKIEIYNKEKNVKEEIIIVN